MPGIVVALALGAHALIHASFLAPRPAPAPGAPAWPFMLERSWALGMMGLEGAGRPFGVLLVVVIVGAYAAAALAFLQVLPQAVFVPGVVAGSLASVVLLAVFFHPWLVLGFAIDAVLLWAVLVNGWKVTSGG